MSQPTQAGPKHPWMRLVLCVLLVCVTAQRSVGQIAGSQPSEATTQASEPLSPDRLFALASPAVVKLIVKDEDDREIANASGFLVASQRAKSDVSGQAIYDSTVITNYHVIRPAVSVDLLFSNGQKGWVSEVISEDESGDIAVLTVHSLMKPTRTLRLHEGPNPPVGTRVYTIGSPQGLGNTLSEGLISGYRELGNHAPWIQITAPISPGSSGGPLLSTGGTVLGITTATIKDGQNLNFAIPAREVQQRLNGSKTPRPVWEGASIGKTVQHAFGTAMDSFLGQCSEASRKDHSRPIPVDEWTAVANKCLETGRREEDQFALLAKGRGLYYDAKAYDEAIATLRRATEVKPGEFGYLAHYALALATRTKILGSGAHVSQHEPVIGLLKKAKELNPDFAPTSYWLAKTYNEMEKHSETLVEADDLVRLMPRCYQGYQLRGQAWAELGRAEAFERDFDTAYELRPNDPEVICAKAYGYAPGSWRKARELYKQAVELCELRPNGYTTSANWRNAQLYEQAVQLDPACRTAHYNVGWACEQIGDYAEAIKWYEESLHLFSAGEVIDGFVKHRIAECRHRLTQSP